MKRKKKGEGEAAKRRESEKADRREETKRETWQENREEMCTGVQPSEMRERRENEKEGTEKKTVGRLCQHVGSSLPQRTHTHSLSPTYTFTDPTYSHYLTSRLFQHYFTSPLSQLPLLVTNRLQHACFRTYQSQNAVALFQCSRQWCSVQDVLQIKLKMSLSGTFWPIRCAPDDRSLVQCISRRISTTARRRSNTVHHNS